MSFRDLSLPPSTSFLADLRLDTVEFRARWSREPTRRETRVGRFSPALAAIVATLVAGAAMFDRREVLWAETIPSTWWSVAQVVTRLGMSGYIFGLAAAVCLCALFLRSRSRRRIVRAELGAIAGRAIFVISVNVVAGLLSQVLKHLVGRARPQLMTLVGPFHFDPLSMQSRLESFPSGHAVTVFCTAAALFSFAPRFRIPLYFIAFAVCLSRLALLDHYPSDIIAGTALGLGSTYLLAHAFARRKIVFVERDGKARARGMGAGLRWWRRRGERSLSTLEGQKNRACRS
jgi:membrane-associated phospholipid phosphatase